MGQQRKKAELHECFETLAIRTHSRAQVITELPPSNTALNQHPSSTSHTVFMSPSLTQPPQTNTSEVYQLSLYVTEVFYGLFTIITVMQL